MRTMNRAGLACVCLLLAGVLFGCPFIGVKVPDKITVNLGEKGGADSSKAKHCCMEKETASLDAKCCTLYRSILGDYLDFTDSSLVSPEEKMFRIGAFLEKGDTANWMSLDDIKRSIDSSDYVQQNLWDDLKSNMNDPECRSDTLHEEFVIQLIICGFASEYQLRYNLHLLKK